MTGTTMGCWVKGQVFTAEDGRRFAIVKVDDVEPFILSPKDATELAQKWSEQFGMESKAARLMTRIAAALNGNGAVQ